MIGSRPERFVSVEPAWEDDLAWSKKLAKDSRSIEDLIPSHLRSLHETVSERARSAGSSALILSGSTARKERTEISDLDYHLIGEGIPTRDLSHELDLHVVSERRLLADIGNGDDFVQWSLRFGLIVFDTGQVRNAHRLIATEGVWPDPQRKREHAEKSLDLARRFVESGDTDGAIEQVRTALSLTARAYLLTVGEFPLSQAELPTQLLVNRQGLLAEDLCITIFESPPLRKLSHMVDRAQRLLRESTEMGRSDMRVHAGKRVRA